MQKGCVTGLVKSLGIVQLSSTGWYMTAVAGWQHRVKKCRFKRGINPKPY
jgi:hypothetical protein